MVHVLAHRRIWRGDGHVEVQAGSGAGDLGGDAGHGLAHVLEWEGFMDKLEGKTISLNYFLIFVFHI